MDFQSTIHQLSSLLSAPLPGEQAQLMMAPPGRPDMRKSLDSSPTPPRQSATLCLLYPERNNVHFVLIQRPAYNGVHGNQISFPGGKKEKQDTHLLDTALRETQEEIGVQSELIEVIGRLSPLYIPPSRFMVSPFVGFCSSKPVFQADPFEVKEILEIPLAFLVDESFQTEELIYIKSRNLKFKTPCFKFNERIVWGATAMMLNELATILRAFPE